MALSDCEKCWDTPCTCGYGYTQMTDEQFCEFIKSLVKGREKYLNRERSMYLKEKECPLCGIKSFRR